MRSSSSDNCMHRHNMEDLNISDPEIWQINTKPTIKTKLKQWLSELKIFKVQTILVLEYKKINDRKIFHSSTKLIASDSDIDEAFKSMHQGIMTQITNYASKDWIVLDVILKHRINFFEFDKIIGDNT